MQDLRGSARSQLRSLRSMRVTNYRPKRFKHDQLVPYAAFACPRVQTEEGEAGTFGLWHPRCVMRQLDTVNSFDRDEKAKASRPVSTSVAVGILAVVARSCARANCIWCT
jgi:hypothetical protein